MGCVQGVLREVVGEPWPHLEPDYEVLKQLGHGADGSVWLCKDLVSRKLVAVKVVPRGAPAWKLGMLGTEAKHLARLGGGNVHVVRAHELFLNVYHVCLVLEYVPGGTLAEYCKKQRVNEALACYFFRQLINIISYCHTNRVAYRDVKLENTLLAKTDPPELYLCDFGAAKKWKASRSPDMNTVVGTPGYMPPEVMGTAFRRSQGYDGTKADVWACGVFLAVLLLKHFPYDYDSFAKRLDREASMELLWQLERERHWREATQFSNRLSPEVKDLLDKMLERDEHLRISLTEVCQHPWVVQRLPAKYELALMKMEQQQAALEKQLGASLGHDVTDHQGQRGADCPRRLAVYNAIDQIISSALTRGEGPNRKVMQVNLNAVVGRECSKNPPSGCMADLTCDVGPKSTAAGPEALGPSVYGPQ